jgi:hypothetical protein
MRVLTWLGLAASLATGPGPIARAVAREATPLAAAEQTRSEGTRGWTRLTSLAPGTEVILTTRGAMSASRVFVLADGSGLIALNLTGPHLPPAVTKTLRRIASESPQRFAAISRGAGFSDADVHVGPDGVWLAGQRVASTEDILDRPSRVDVLEVRTAKSRAIGFHGAAGALAGAVGGVFLGAMTGSAIENKWRPCHCDDPGLKGTLVGAPIGAIGGAVLGYHASRHVAQDILYRAP